MDKNYIKFILAYDFGDVFEGMELACDEAFDLAEEIADRFLEYREKIYLSEYNMSEYELLQEFCLNLSFTSVWNDMHKNQNHMWR